MDQTHFFGRISGPRADIPPYREIAGTSQQYAGTNENERFELREWLSDLGTFPTSHKICVAPQLGATKQQALYEEGSLPEEIVRQHYDGSIPPALYLYGLVGHELGGAGFLQANGKVLFQLDLLPSYIGRRLLADGHNLDDQWCGSLFDDDAQVLDLDCPIATVLHPNLVYGHFLLEIFPKLHLLSRLRRSGLAFPIAVPEQISTWVKEIIGLYFSPDEILFYDARKTRIRSPCFILPSMMHTNYQFHPDFNLAIEEIKAHVLGNMRPTLKRRIWISRAMHSGRATLRNEAEVEAAMRSLGFEVVHPQELTFPEQIALFDSADCVVAEYGSAVHNTLFSRRGTRVLCLNRINWYQSGIGRLRTQSLAYLAPSDGRFRDWRSQKTQDASFDIDCGQLRTIVERFLQPCALDIR